MTKSKWLWSAGAVVAATVGMVALAQAPQDEASDVEDLERRLKSTPVQPMMAAIKQNYPDDYRQIMSDLNDKMNDPDVSSAQLTAYSGERIMGFYASKKPDALNASEESLVAIGRRTAKFVDRLSKENVKACAQFSTTGFRADVGLTDAQLTENNHINALAFAAAKEGSKRQRDPARGKLADADADLWGDAMATFDYDEDLYQMMQDEAQLAKASEQELCRIGRLSWGGAVLLPKGAAARVTAYLLSDEE